ncbi:hypothetical protein JXB02_00915 [Candidatus Woesearchaeota archaeon]|nr:hypothetical protein [Candidatus Woesearchaeota archaeon]
MVWDPGKRRRAQISIEYLVIMGFVLLLLLPTVAMFLLGSEEMTDSINVNQASRVAHKIVDAAESVYYYGAPSQTTVRAYFPDNIQAVTIDGTELVFRMGTTAGPSDIVAQGRVNMTGNLTAKKGIYTVKVKAFTSYVNISYE